ncbi:MAG: hypothetical protein ACSLE1_15135 [Sphingobium sp.]
MSGIWKSIVTALLVFASGSVAVNMLAVRASDGTAIQRGFNDGALETITPVSLAPWWLTARAQLDCQQFMPLVSNNDDVASAVSRTKIVLSDQKANACTLVASMAERKRAGTNMRETQRHDGFHSAGSLTLPAISMLGIKATRWINVILLLTVAAAGLWFVFRKAAASAASDRVAATICMTVASGFILAVPGSLTAMPSMTLILASLMASFFLLVRGVEGWPFLLKLSPWLAVALESLDPLGGSVPVGLGCVMFMARMFAPLEVSRTTRLRPAMLYVGTIILCWLVYALLVLATDDWPSAAEALVQQAVGVGGKSLIDDLGAAITGAYKWISGENLLGPLGAFDLLFTLVLGLLIYCAVKPARTEGKWTEPMITALLTIAPVIMWAILYAADWRRAEEQYALPLVWLIAVALAGPFTLVIEGARRVARGRRTPATAVEISALA